MDRNELFFAMNLDYDDIRIVKKLAEYYQEWSRLNKICNDIEILESRYSKSVIVIHNMYDNFSQITDSWGFVNDIKYFLKLYSDESKEDCEFMIDFWEDKIKRLNEIGGD